MEYIFGITRRHCENVEYLRTKDIEHTNLIGQQELIMEYPDSIITDSFFIVDHYREDEDEQNNYYDWYEIKNHNRNIDKFTPVQGYINTTLANIQDALCDITEDLEYRITDIEDALCDLSEMEV